MSNIPSTPADGLVRTDVVTAIADIKAPKLTELNAATTKNISCYLTAGGFGLAVTEATIDDPRECDVFDAKRAGRAAVDGDLTGIDNTGTDNQEFNDFVDALPPGAIVYLVRRYGKAFDAAYAAGQPVDIFMVEVGKKKRGSVEANSVLKSSFGMYVQDFSQDVEIAA